MKRIIGGMNKIIKTYKMYNIIKNILGVLIITFILMLFTGQLELSYPDFGEVRTEQSITPTNKESIDSHINLLNELGRADITDFSVFYYPNAQILSRGELQALTLLSENHAIFIYFNPETQQIEYNE
jgi:hypothetical protein